MNWNQQTERLTLRLPVTDKDGDALFELLKDPEVSAHIPKPPMYASVQGLDELRRATMQFQSREAATWLLERHGDDQVLARIRLLNINWLMLSAQLQWELSPKLAVDEVDEALAAIHAFCFQELGLHRLDMRICEGAKASSSHLIRSGYEYEGCLPAQLEFESRWINLEMYSLLSEN